MKRTTLVIILLAVLVVSCLALTACHSCEFGDWTITRQPTCTEDGIAVGFCKCGAQTTETVPPNGHNYKSVVTEPTCGNQGYTTHSCSDCGDSYVDTYVDALGHDEGSVVVKNSVDPNCTKDGSYDNVVYCTVCNAVLSMDTVVVDALGHDEVSHEAQAPTCTEKGWDAYVTCSRCNYTTYNEIPATGHNYENSVCINCGEPGVELELSSDETHYIVSGLKGDCDETDIIIPSTYRGKPVTSIGSNAFRACTSLTSITMPNSITSIGEYAFYNCKGLSSIEIPSSVTSIGDSTFSGCERLTSIIIPSSVTSIGAFAFSYCDSFISITIPGSVASIGSGAFYLCESLTSITILEGVISICSSAFSSCKSLTSITIPESVKSIGDSAFSGCKILTSVTIIGNGITSIGSSAFSSCKSLESITIPSSVTSIGSGAFYRCSNLNSIIIPEGVTSIGEDTFEECSSLISVVVPQSVTSIGWSAFSSCSSLTDVYYSGTKEQWNGITIGDSNWDLTGATIHYNYKG